MTPARRRYETDLSEAEWALLVPLLVMLNTLLRRSVRLSRQQHTEELCQTYAAA